MASRPFSPFAWGALALGSALPLVLWQELSGDPVPVWLLLAQSGALLALIFAARRLPRLRPSRTFCAGCCAWPSAGT